MQIINTPFWAKKDETAGRYLWLPLGQHLEDTRNICGLLWEHWLCDAQRNVVASALMLNEKDDFLTAENLYDKAKSLAQFIAAAHDIGKACPAFQAKRNFYGQEDLNKQLLEKLEFAGFRGISELRLADANRSHHAIAGHALLKSYGVGDDICSIISSHHGSTIGSLHEVDCQKAYLENYFQNENKDDEIYKKWKNSQRQYFDWALNVNGFKEVSELPRIKQSGQVMLAGLLVMADWIASNQNYFPLISIEQSEIKDQRKRIEKAWTAWQKNQTWDSHISEHAASLYEKRFNFIPNEIQKKAADIIEIADKTGIVIIEAPMGSGKTEMALVLTELLANKRGSCGMFFGLPTQATSNGIFPRIEDWLNNIAKERGDALPLRLVHGKAALNEDFRSLADNIDQDGDQDSKLFVNEWFSGRKTANLDDFVVGTVDQFLLLALKQRHLQLRHLGFSRKVVIIDEVHAYDAYMSQYLYRAVTWMGAYNVPVIMLSATLPKQKRKDIMEAYMKGKGFDMRKDQIKYPDGNIDIDDYPLITYSDGNLIRRYRDFKNTDNKHVRVVQLDEKEQLMPLLEKIMQNDGITGIMVNTVKKAQKIAQDCADRFGEEAVELLHSGYIATDRVKKETKLLNMIGKDAKRPSKKIIIGTQVIEQSLDIDFDVLISELAPMDLLIQRIGRLFRHDILRPKQHKEPVVYVMGINYELNFDEGSAAVYSPYILAKTQYYMPETINLPSDISYLVQKVYGDDELCFENKQTKAKFYDFQTKYGDFIKIKEFKAKTFRIKAPVFKKSFIPGKGTLIAWLNGKNPIENDTKAFAQVRDSGESIEVIALKKVGESGYGFFDKLKDLSYNINDSSVAKQIASHTIKLPTVLSMPWNIDKTIGALEKYNIKYLSSWQRQTWLKGTLGIIFDDNDEFILCGCCLKYSTKYGLSYEFLRGENV
ncbi:MAG: CRISPR-associated helicase Cas3' [Christensenellales bacterium]|jgi:CRISPR-associated endonuclease/helicase Cas3